MHARARVHTRGGICTRALILYSRRVGVSLSSRVQGSVGRGSKSLLLSSALLRPYYAAIACLLARMNTYGLFRVNCHVRRRTQPHLRARRKLSKHARDCIPGSSPRHRHPTLSSVQEEKVVTHNYIVTFDMKWLREISSSDRRLDRSKGETRED